MWGYTTYKCQTCYILVKGYCYGVLVESWLAVVCSKSEQRYNAEYILANKKRNLCHLSATHFLSFFLLCLLTFQLEWLWKLWKIVRRQFASSLCLHLPPIWRAEQKIESIFVAVLLLILLCQHLIVANRCPGGRQVGGRSPIRGHVLSISRHVKACSQKIPHDTWL